MFVMYCIAMYGVCAFVVLCLCADWFNIFVCLFVVYCVMLIGMLC